MGRMSRTLKIVAAVVALVVIGGVAGFFVWNSGERARQQQALAARLATTLSALKIDNADFHATTGVDPSSEFATVVKGMGSLKPQVTVTGVKQRSDDRYADATLHYVWTPLPNHEPWAYDVTIPLQETADGWKATWSASDVAPGLKDTERLLYNRLQPTRGSVLGANAAKIAYNQPAIRIGIDKSALDPTATDAAARALATALTAGGVAVNADSYASKVATAGTKAFVEAALLRTTDPKQSALATQLKGTPGVAQLSVQRALGITSSFLRPILGQVGEANADQVKNSGGSIMAGDMVGTGGLQLSQDATLRGDAGYVVQAILRQGSQARDLKRVVAVDGQDVQTTIDVRLQSIAESVLASQVPASALVAIRPSDGAILAAASGPGSNGYSTATLGLYEPGSTFKTVSGLAMIRKEGLTATSTIQCPDSLVVDGYTFHNDDGFPAEAVGAVPWTTAFAQSCNTAVLGQADKISQADLVAAAAAMGVSGAPNLGVNASFGKIPATADTATKHAASMIGQGDVQMTPLGMAVVTASIAKGGLVTPSLVVGAQAAPAASGSASAASSGTPSAAAPAVPAQPINATEAGTLKTLMRAVVTEGTAQTALAGTPGAPVMAKTGTSTFTENGKNKYHTWLIAMQGDLAVAVMVADGDFGATTCGPILKSFLTQKAALG